MDIPGAQKGGENSENYFSSLYFLVVLQYNIQITTSPRLSWILAIIF